MTTSLRPAAPACPLTGGPMVHWLRVPCDWRRPAADGRYELYWSAWGRFGQVYPRPTADEVASYYAVDYYTHGRAAEAPRPRGLLERVREHLAWRFDFGTDLTAERMGRHAAGRRHPAVLEFGCGDGRLLADLKQAGWRSVGVEPDPAARAVARSRGLEVIDGTAEDPPAALRGHTFDAVVMQHVLEHCRDPLAALRAAAGFLRPDGVLVVETPNNDALSLRLAGPAWPWLDVPRHLNFFTAHSLRLACAAAGLAVESTAYTGYTRQYRRVWADMEGRIREAYRVAGGRCLARPSGRAAWRQLLRTAFAASALKYDSVRITARRRTAKLQ